VNDEITDESDVAVIGAGCAGAVCAHTLWNRGMDVTVYEKSRGHGGRASTRYIDNGETVTVDHGAQYFTVKSETLIPYLESWQRNGVVAEWQMVPVVIEDGQVVNRKPGPERYVGTPTMNAPVKKLMSEVGCQFDTRVTELRRIRGRWRLRLDDGRTGFYQNVVCTAPPKQIASLLDDELPDLREWLREQTFEPTWCYGAILDVPVDVEWKAGFVNDDSPVDWIAQNSSKPSRNGPETWVLHANHEWSKSHLEVDRQSVCERLRTEFLNVVEGESGVIREEFAHRWRYAKPAHPREVGAVVREGLALAGDWLCGSRVDGAMLSGVSAAEDIMNLSDDVS